MTLYERYMLIQYEERAKAWGQAIRNPWYWVWTFGWLIGLILFLSLSGCASTPVTVVERVNVPTYIPIASTLTQPIQVDLIGATWGSAVGSLNAALQTCNADKAAIASLKPPTGL